MDHGFKHMEARQLNWNAHRHGIGDWIAGREGGSQKEATEKWRDIPQE